MMRIYISLIITCFVLASLWNPVIAGGKTTSIAKDLIEIVKYAKKKYDKYDKIRKELKEAAAFYLNTSQVCAASGASNCQRRAGICVIYKYGLEKYLVGNFVIKSFSDALVRQYCLGTPALKCCTNSITKGGCHTAFNEEAPINCEGIAATGAYGPPEGVFSPGVCLPKPVYPGGPGCDCCYLAECECSRSYFSDTKNYHMGRVDSFYYSAFSVTSRLSLQSNFTELPLSNSHEAEFGVPQRGSSVVLEMIDFVRFRGCSNFVELQQQALEFNESSFQILNAFGKPVSHGMDLVDELYGARAVLPHIPIARLAADIPQFWKKTEYVLGTEWNATSRIEALKKKNITDPELELLQYTDFGGINFLKKIFRENWILLAVPVNESLWTLPTASQVEGKNSSLHCQVGNGRGKPVEVTHFSVSQAKNLATLNFSVSDPEKSDLLDALVCWGDRTSCDKTTFESVGKSSLTVTVVHTYAECGTFYVSVGTANKSGLRTFAQKTLQVPCTGSSNVPLSATMESYPSVLSVELQLSVTFSWGTTGPGDQLYYFQGSTSVNELTNTSFSDPNSTDFDFLGAQQSLAKYRQPVNVTISVSLDWVGQPLRYIRITCRSWNNYLYNRAFAKVAKVSVRLASGELVSVPFVVHWKVAVMCSRRGDLFDDDQQFAVIELGAIRDGTIEEDSPSGPFDLDGIYFEKVPRRFIRQAAVTQPSTSKATAAPTIKMSPKSPAKVPIKRPFKVPSKRPSKLPTKRPTKTQK